jgi:hypothetical protein
MDWSNERYVRLYCSDTKSWLLFGWEGQAVLSLLLRKVDRSGMLDDVYDAEDVALMLGSGFPVDVAERGLSRLTKKGTVVITESGLLVPNYIEAQETPKSDAQRQRDARENRRAKAKAVVTKRDASVTNRDNLSRGVTDGHTLSQPVTLTCADPVLTNTSTSTSAENIYINNKTSKDQVEETSKVDLKPIDEALEFLPIEQDRLLAKFILTAWPDCTVQDAIAWIQQAKNYLLQLEGDPLEWIQDVATSRSPNDPVYVQGRNKLHQWLMNCLKNTIRKQAEQSKPKLSPVKYGMDT